MSRRKTHAIVRGGQPSGDDGSGGGQSRPPPPLPGCRILVRTCAGDLAKDGDSPRRDARTKPIDAVFACEKWLLRRRPPPPPARAYTSDKGVFGGGKQGEGCEDDFSRSYTQARARADYERTRRHCFTGFTIVGFFFSQTCINYFVQSHGKRTIVTLTLYELVRYSKFFFN